MAKVKGCTKSGCVANSKKIHYKKDDEFCSKCGMELSFVCKKCHTPIAEDNKGSLCLRCVAEKEDKRDVAMKKAGKAGQKILVVGGIVAGIGKGAWDIARKR